MKIFYAVTQITVGSGHKTPFWEAPWLHGRKPKDLAPLIFAISKRKSWKVNQAMKDNAWVGKFKLDDGFSLQHLHQFVQLWVALQNVQLHENVEDDIIWRLTASGSYTTKSAYEVQFLGSTYSIMHKTV
jgi:hypothetical protein